MAPIQSCCWWSRDDGFDPAWIENIYNAKNAGLNVELVLTTCRAVSVEEEMDYLMKKIGEGVLDRIWVHPDDVDMFCRWSDF